MASTQYDIVIVGGGMIGLTLASLLHEAGLDIAVVEARIPPAVGEEVDIRVSAINRASAEIFQRIGAWNAMLQRHCGYQEMHVWDSTGMGSIHFDSAELGLDVLGHIIENSVIQQALLSSTQASAQVDWLCPHSIESIALSSEQHHVLLDNGDSLTCRLLIGADGARSIVRDVAEIEFRRTAYGQQAVVCTVATEYDHQHTAWQCFLPSGPLAFLPLFDGRCSIVWTLDDDRVGEVMALDDETFCRALEQAFEYKLGAVTSVGQRATFPLAHGHACDYVQQGVALVGDAAHNIHPLAGQGANLGFLDAASLARVIIEAVAANRQWYALHTLRKYQRDRKAENRLMEMSMSSFKLLFGNEQPILSSLRNTGLVLVDHASVLKRAFMRHALDGH